MWAMVSMADRLPVQQARELQVLPFVLVKSVGMLTKSRGVSLTAPIDGITVYLKIVYIMSRIAHFLLLLALASGLAAPAHSDSGAPIFEDAAAATGLQFTHWNGSTGQWYFPEINGSGVALFDYDNDGDLDIYLVQGALLGEPAEGVDLASLPANPRDRLFRNDLETRADGTRILRFTDVTQKSRITAEGYGMGVATGDFDNDGHVDLYVTHFGPNQMWRNRGDGTFEDVTEAWGAFENRWSIAAAVIDYDRDGWLDLYLGNYLRFEFARQKSCVANTGARDYCHPLSYLPESDRLLHNIGGKRFEDISSAALPDRGEFSTLGVVTGDFNADGWLDLYVANDEMPNQLWLNQHDGTFSEEALLGGCAVNGRGKPEASMGVDSGDVDNDGDEDLFMAHLTQQTNTLYLNDGRGLFRDLTTPRGLGTPSWNHTGFGTVFLDYDNDGWLDVLVVNGAVGVIEDLQLKQDPFPFHEPNQLFRNLGNGHFEEVSDAAGEVFQQSEVSRGAAAGDLDNDGDIDVVVTNNNGPARLLLNRNESRPGASHRWLGLTLVAGTPERLQLGAVARTHQGDTISPWRRVRTDGSYASARDPRLHFGLGNNDTPASIEVRWPDGTQETFPALALDSYHTLRRGSGEVAPVPESSTEESTVPEKNASAARDQSFHQATAAGDSTDRSKP